MSKANMKELLSFNSIQLFFYLTLPNNLVTIAFKNNNQQIPFSDTSHLPFCFTLLRFFLSLPLSCFCQIEIQIYVHIFKRIIVKHIVRLMKKWERNEGKRKKNGKLKITESIKQEKNLQNHLSVLKWVLDLSVQNDIWLREKMKCFDNYSGIYNWIIIIPPLTFLWISECVKFFRWTNLL